MSSLPLQQTDIPTHPSLRRSNAVRHDRRRSYILSSDEPSVARIDFPLKRMFSFEALSPDGDVVQVFTTDVHHGWHSLNSLQTSSRNPFAGNPRVSRRVQRPRYYKHALSEEDRQALIRGEKNHNLTEWTQKDLLRFHEARKQLIPLDMSKRDKMDIIAHIEQEKDNSQSILRQVQKKVCRRSWFSIFTRGSSETLDEVAYVAQVSRAVFDIRPSRRPTLPPLLKTSLKSSDSIEESSLEHHRTHIHASSGGDYFMRPPASRPPSSHAARTSSQTFHSLVFERQQTRANPAVTFDTFIAPHALGKREAYRGAANMNKGDLSCNESEGST